MADEFKPRFSAEDFMHLATQDFYLKMSIDGQNQVPFSGRATVLEVPDSSHSFMRECVRESRARYALPIECVSQALLEAECGTSLTDAPGYHIGHREPESLTEER